MGPREQPRLVPKNRHWLINSSSDSWLSVGFSCQDIDGRARTFLRAENSNLSQISLMLIKAKLQPKVTFRWSREGLETLSSSKCCLTLKCMYSQNIVFLFFFLDGVEENWNSHQVTCCCLCPVLENQRGNKWKFLQNEGNYHSKPLPSLEDYPSPLVTTLKCRILAHFLSP